MTVRLTPAHIVAPLRLMFLSEEHRKAYTAVIECLGGADASFAQDLLDGKQTLVDDPSSPGNMMSAPDTAQETEEYRKQARYIYGGRVRVKGTWWRPRAIVVDIGAGAEIDYACRKMGVWEPKELSGRGGIEYDRYRAEYYAREDEKVLAWRGKQAIIFEPCGDPPHWWRENKTPKDALADSVAAGRDIDRVGYSIDSEFDPPVKVAESPRVRVVETVDDDARVAADFDAMITRVRATVLERNVGVMIDLRDIDGNVHATVPRAPFVAWALNKTRLSHLAPPWRPIAEMGLKMGYDNPTHSDWMIGGGLPLEGWYGEETPLKKAAYHTAGLIQHELGDFQCTVIAEGHGEAIDGVVGKGIAVLPDLNPDHLPVVMRSVAVITEAGGAMAHLVQVTRDRNIPIILVAGAVTKFPPGTELSIDPSAGRVEIVSSL